MKNKEKKHPCQQQREGKLRNAIMKNPNSRFSPFLLFSQIQTTQKGVVSF